MPPYRIIVKQSILKSLKWNIKYHFKNYVVETVNNIMLGGKEKHNLKLGKSREKSERKICKYIYINTIVNKNLEENTSTYWMHITSDVKSRPRNRSPGHSTKYYSIKLLLFGDKSHLNLY